jgi:hypothetical protein
MRRHNTFLVVISLVILFHAPDNSPAQTVQPSTELGFQFSVLRQNNSIFFSTPELIFRQPHIGRWTPGLGGRGVYNITRYWSVEGEMNIFPGDNAINGRILEGLVGTKYGLRRKRAGFFAKVRPGLLHMSKSLSSCGFASLTDIRCVFERTRNDFALDVGGVLELYSSRRWLVRFDMGDTVQFFRGNKNVEFFTFTPVSRINVRPVKIAQSSQDMFDERPHTFHNLQFSAGVSFHF